MDPGFILQLFLDWESGTCRFEDPAFLRMLAFCASVTSIGNVGPAVGELGSMGNFNGISVAAKLLFTTDMFLGRVEIYPLLAVIGMIFDRHGR